MKISRKFFLKTSSRRLGLKRLGWMVAFVIAAGLSLFAGQVQAQTFPPGPDDDNTTSLGQFRIFVHPDFRPLLSNYPGFDGMRLLSPPLYDGNTVIGRSAPHLDGDAADLGGTPVGSAGTIISDANFRVLPPGFQGPLGTREVHTEVRSLNLISDFSVCEGLFGLAQGAAVRAGINAPLRPISPGEVESHNELTGDFPAESFFNVFVEVDLPFLGTLYNSEPLLVVNDSVKAFPPRVVYIHGNSEAVPVLFRDDHPGGLWQADDLFGWLVLAGHGPEFTCNSSDVFEFVNFLQEQPEMHLPFCQVTFDSLVLGTIYGASAGNLPGDVIFTENNVPVAVQNFFLSPGTTTFNVCEVGDGYFGFNTGQNMQTNNINLEFDFTALGFTPNRVSFEFTDTGGGFENISVNGQPVIIGELANAPSQMPPGFTLTVTTFRSGGADVGEATLTGPIQTLLIGGQELWLDNICAQQPCISDGDVNGDDELTPGDALCAFQIFLNNQNLPPDCDAPNFDCEVVAADANCDSVSTPGDALAIFERYLMALPPEECFADTSLSKLSLRTTPHQLSLTQHKAVQPAESADKPIVKISLAVDNPAGLKAFGLKLSYPADKLEFLGVERTALTANWIQLDGQVNAPGVITLGGFHIEPVASTTPGELFQVLFAPKGHSVVNTAEFELSYLVDNFSDAIVKMDAGSTSQSVASVPKVFKLHQNFPNPFQIKTLSSQTLIRFDLPGMEAVKVELAIYNVTGQLVRHLISETRLPGAYEIMWDGKDEQGRLVTSGIYLYRLKAGNQVASKRITVAR